MQRRPTTCPKDLGLQLSTAQAQVGAGSLDRAQSYSKRAEQIDANSYRMHAIRGEIDRIQDKEGDAVSEYKAAITNLPAEPDEGQLYGIQLHMDLSAGGAACRQ